MPRKPRKISSIQAEDGTPYDVRFDKNTGIFSIEVNEQTKFSSSKMTEVVDEATEWLRVNQSLTWEKFLAIETENNSFWSRSREDQDHTISFSYSRFFRATLVDGSYLYRQWEEVFTDKGNEIRPASEVNVFGKIKGDPKVFKMVKMGDQVTIEKI